MNGKPWMPTACATLGVWLYRDVWKPAGVFLILIASIFILWAIVQYLAGFRPFAFLQTCAKYSARVFDPLKPPTNFTGLFFGITVTGLFLIFGVGRLAPASREWISENLRYRTAKESYLRGRESYLKFYVEPFAKAQSEFDTALRQRPSYAKAHGALGELYAAWAYLERYRGGNPGDLSSNALRHALAAAALQPGLFESHRSLAAALAESGEYKLALDEADRALELNPENREARFWKWTAEGAKYDSTYFRSIENDASYEFLPGLIAVGFSLETLHKSEEARQFFRKAESVAKKNQTDVPLIDVGQANTYRDDAGSPENPGYREMAEKAISGFRRAAQLDDKLVIAHSNLGNAYLVQGRWADALPHFERALEIDPQYQIAAFNKALACYELRQDGQAKAAWKHTETILILGTDARTQAFGKLSEALRAYLGGQTKQAVDAYRTAVDAGHKEMPPLNLDDPKWCLENQVLGPRGISLLRKLMALVQKSSQ